MGFFNDLKEDLAAAVNELTDEKVEEEISLNEEQLREELARFDEQDKKKEQTNNQKSDLEKEIQDILNGIGDESKIDTSVEFSEVVDDNNGDVVDTDGESNLSSEDIPDNVETEEVSLSEEESQSVEIKESKLNIEVNDMPSINKEKDICVTVITSGTVINGDIVSEGDVTVDGRVKGNIEIGGKLVITGELEGDLTCGELYADSSKINGIIDVEGPVKISENSIIIGDIKAASAVIAGAVKGNIDITGAVVLDSNAKILGDINSKYVQINNGAVIEGRCTQSYSEITPSKFFENL